MIELNSIFYIISSSDKDNMVIKDYGEVSEYVYTNKEYLQILKKSKPFIGLSEKYINNTSFGKYDEKDNNDSFNKYYWYYNLDNKEVKAIVEVDKDYKNHDDETGKYKISNIYLYKKGQYYLSNYGNKKNNVKKYRKSQLEDIASDYDDYESFYYDYKEYLTYEEAYDLWIDNHSEAWDSEEYMDSEW